MRPSRIVRPIAVFSIVGLILAGVGSSQSGSEKIVYSAAGPSGSVELHAVTVDAGATRALTSHTPQGIDPAWSPDSRAIVFSGGKGSGDEFDSTGLWRVPANGIGARQLALQERDGSLYPRYSPNGRLIAFSDDDRLLVIDRVGRGRRVIARHDTIEALSWSPDGRRIAFSSYDGIFVVTLRTARVTRITRPQTSLEREGGYFWGPAWSPDGKLIAATKGSVVSDENTLIVVKAAGGGQRSLGRGWTPFWISPSKLVAVLVDSKTGRGNGIRFLHANGRSIRKVNPPGDEFAFGWARRAKRLVFATQKGNVIRLFKVDPSRGPTRALTRPVGPVRGDQHWSPDGQRVAVERAWRGDDGDYVFVVELLRPGGKAIRILDPGVDSHPSPSPDGSQAVYARSDGQLDEIVVMKADGGDPHRIATGRRPIWSPRGDKIAFERAGAIYAMNADGSSQVRLASGNSPAFSPDGAAVVFARQDAISVVATADGAEKRLTGELCAGAATVSEPAWSSNSAWIAFTLDCGGLGIVVMRSDGSDLKWLTPGASPSWSPSGATIAFRKRYEETGGDFLYTMKPDGSELQALAKDGLAPIWSPDGQRLAYAVYRGGEDYSLHVINVDGTGERRIVDYASGDYDGPWPFAWLR